ncbi:MAG: hypothetical protein HY040_13060 [Planctomycetes bacterium]|nr:hypothetical protein [Planctomycetota bacterium]
MAIALRPVAKCVYVCDEVVADPSSGKISVLNLWDAIRIPATAALPYTLKKVSVFVWCRDGLGKMKTRIDIIEVDSETVVRRTKSCVLDFKRRTDSIFARYKLANCIFPRPGDYLIEVYCEGEFIDDQVIRVGFESGE